MTQPTTWHPKSQWTDKQGEYIWECTRDAANEMCYRLADAIQVMSDSAVIMSKAAAVSTYRSEFTYDVSDTVSRAVQCIEEALAIDNNLGKKLKDEPA